MFTAKPPMYMLVPPTQKWSVVLSALHSQWHVSVMFAQFSVMSAVQHGAESAVTHSDWE